LATGLHYQRDGQWVDSKEEIELFQDGAIARQGQHQVIFTPNINTAGAIDLLTPDGRFRSHILGLAYTDAATGNSAMIAQIKDSTGQLVAPNQIIYADAFTDFQADIRYTYTRAGFEQDIILREEPPSPVAYGLNPTTTRLEVYTEFLDPPMPSKEVTVLKQESNPILRAAMFEPDLVDERLNFGAMLIGSGNAFPLSVAGEETDADNFIPVGKSWEQREGRVFLIEKVDYVDIQPHLLPLPKAAAVGRPKKALNAGTQQSKQKKLLVEFPSPPVRVKDSNTMRMANLPQNTKGLVLDYVLLSSSSNFTFKSDTTYLLSGSLTLSGTTKIEGGTVLKYTNIAPGNSPWLTLSGPVDCQTTAYRPAIFTAKDDNSVGETIAGSTGTPVATNYYAFRALTLTDTTTTHDLHDLRFRYADRAIHFQVGATVVVSRVQISYGRSGIASANTSADLSIRNALFTDLGTAVLPLNSNKNRGEQLTLHRVGFLKSQQNIWLTNSLLIAVTNTGTIIGSNVETNLDDTGIFQTVGAGAHYLASNSAYRNAGTTNINAGLLADLKRKTTYPPLVLSNNITTATTLSPQAGRDTDTPDLGYHYDPLDYLIGGITLSNATLLVTNGTAVGIDTTVTNWGLRLDSGGNVISEGSPLNLNRFVRTHCVQELRVGAGSNGVPVFADTYPAPSNPITLRFRFTDLPFLSASHLLNQENNRGTFSVLSLRDSQVRGGNLYYSPGISNCVFSLTNTLFERISAHLYPYHPDSVSAFNNLFKEGSWSLSPGSGNSWTLKDNLFDKTTLWQNTNVAITHNFNGYIAVTNRLLPNGANDVMLTNSPTYDIGPLGRYYYPTNDGMLSLLINAGSQNATNAGLYHFTTTTNQVKETNSTVDIGLHWIALNNGVPFDTDGDGAPDYLEDTNGNGSADSWETDWQSYNSPHGLTGSPGLQIFTPLK